MALVTERLAPTTTATAASIAQNSSRRRVTLINQGAVDLYVSDRATDAGTPATPTSKSVRLGLGDALTLYTKAALYVFTATGTGALQYVEETP